MPFKRILKIIGWIVLAVIAIIPTYLLSAYILSRMSVAKEPGNASDVQVYLITNGVHSDIVLPVKTKQADWTNEIKFEHTTGRDTTARYIAFGWGDKGFYLETPEWADLKFSVACRAAFGYGNSAMHATFYKQMREGKTCVRIPVSNEQYGRLVNYIRNSFSTDPAGHVINIITKANYDSNDAFYEAKGSYSIFHTCNTWTNNALKSCGQKACKWTPFDTGIFYQYE
ncbi:MAG: TIGR02117 family protein [Sphingobacteriales bacterium]|nr:MAG: TIGR02117 family protein [Sphingobacteriales bacterium]